MNRLLKNTTIFLLLVLIVLSAYTWGSNKEDVRSLTYSDFCQMVEEGQVREVSISADYEAGRYTVNGTTVGGESFRTILFPDPDIAAYLTENGVKISYDAVTTSWWVSMLATLIPMLLIVGLFVFLKLRDRHVEIVAFGFVKRVACVDGMPDLRKRSHCIEMSGKLVLFQEYIARCLVIGSIRERCCQIGELLAKLFRVRSLVPHLRKLHG